AQYMLMSLGLMDSSIETSAVTGLVHSLISAAAICECASIIPGITYLPEASTVSTPSGAERSCPIPVIIPSSISTSVCFLLPSVMVTTVPLEMSTDPFSCPYALKLNQSPHKHSMILFMVFPVVILLIQIQVW